MFFLDVRLEVIPVHRFPDVYEGLEICCNNVNLNPGSGSSVETASDRRKTNGSNSPFRDAASFWVWTTIPSVCVFVHQFVHLSSQSAIARQELADLSDIFFRMFRTKHAVDPFVALEVRPLREKG